MMFFEEHDSVRQRARNAKEKRVENAKRYMDRLERGIRTNRVAVIVLALVCCTLCAVVGRMAWTVWPQ